MSDRDKHLALAQSLMENWSSNDWDGDSPLSKLADARFIVRIEREDDSWLVAADDLLDVARILLSCYTDTEGYDEWISHVWDVETGEEIEYSAKMVVMLTVGGDTAKVEKRL
jgi:hypothetical protein